jgi:hypothetical protein
MTKTYRGSCHCGRVKFEADLDLTAGTSKCNCTGCWKRRLWSVRARTEAFRALTGQEELRESRPMSSGGPGGFCVHCGVMPYRWIDAAEWNDGAYVSVNVAALDDLDPAELLAAPVTLCDGRANNWWNVPAEARHL